MELIISSFSSVCGRSDMERFLFHRKGRKLFYEIKKEAMHGLPILNRYVLSLSF
ncbi:hypothetical protein ANACAC_00978 [Anaerostipes caccae L1-92]|uniref:Uncharacterized protein n=1 Tax=Anaerostipes caccae (strain DSM 14662 / CCUG 47493 / JCM 13470 / NCIMB 13811 / L1-92) TaxID=411490 RepID=B0MBG1_ANACD|nr:hypothetical protein ANACAC_00978 [Anaerostipes caccae L1-92]